MSHVIYICLGGSLAHTACVLKTHKDMKPCFPPLGWRSKKGMAGGNALEIATILNVYHALQDSNMSNVESDGGNGSWVGDLLILSTASWKNHGPPKSLTHTHTPAYFLAKQRYPQEEVVVWLFDLSQECVFQWVCAHFYKTSYNKWKSTRSRRL